MQYPKRLVEVDLPILKISLQARREKDMRRGHIPLLHIWPATRPPAACRSIICAALWPDPADPNCPKMFREEAAILLNSFRDRMGGKKIKADDPREVREGLLQFIAEFANWDNSTNKHFVEMSRKLTKTAHESLGGHPGTKPLIFDPFSGGGAIPLEALRVGADAFASDLNPIAVLINKVILEYIPRYKQALAENVLEWGAWIKKEAEYHLADFYPKDADGATPIAYLWARTIKCEGPKCGAEVPLLRSLLLAKKGKHGIGLKIVSKDNKSINFQIVNNASLSEFKNGTVRRGAATCPLCNYTTPVTSVRKQLAKKQGGVTDSKLVAVVTTYVARRGRSYRLPVNADFEAVQKAKLAFQEIVTRDSKSLTEIPNETFPLMSGVFNAPIYGHDTWGSVFTPRQLVYITFVIRKTREYISKIKDKDYAQALSSILGLVIDKMIDMNAALCVWQTHAEIPAHVFGRWAIQMVWDYAEANPLAGSSGSPESATKRTCDGIFQLIDSNYTAGQVIQSSATKHLLPDNSAQILVTDPPYYNAIPYADISDYFYVWLKRLLKEQHPELFKYNLAPKEDEICEMACWDNIRYAHKTKDYFETGMKHALSEAKRILAPNGIAVIVFAHKSTAGWEALLQATIDSGWTITSSWPIDTEMVSRLRAKNSATLSSSVHLVCRPRSDHRRNPDAPDIGDWRDILAELPNRIHEWMPHLAQEGIVGADAIFACLGPALEIFSRYSLVEKASGDKVELKEYLEHVWAAVAKEALTMIFTGADASGFEEDARLTAMWLWTIRTGDSNGTDSEDAYEEHDEDDEKSSKKAGKGGFSLEYDAARKIAQGLGAHLENLQHLVAIQGDSATLLPVAARTRYLFGKESAEVPKGKTRKKDTQLKLDFGEELKQIEEESGTWLGDLRGGAGRTILDQLHQSMILFGAGRNEALRRFLVDEGIGSNPLFWRLAQALSALYTAGLDEKRWVDGILARKKSFGF